MQMRLTKVTKYLKRLYNVEFYLYMIYEWTLTWKSSYTNEKIVMKLVADTSLITS